MLIGGGPTLSRTSPAMTMRRLRIFAGMAMANEAGLMTSGPGGPCQRGASRGEIVVELPLEGVGRGERLYVAQARHPAELHEVAVEVGRLVEEMDLERTARVAEGGPGALMHHPPAGATGPFGAYGVDAVRWEELAVVGKLQVDGPITDGAAASRAGHDRRREGVRPAQKPGGPGQVPARDGPADHRRRYAPTVHGDGVHDVHREVEAAPQGSEHSDVPGATASHAVVEADDQLSQVVPAHQEPDELLGGQVGQLAGEPHEDHGIQLALCQHLAALVRQREQWWCGGRVDDFQRVRLERDQQATAARAARPIRDLLEHAVMAQVHAVEGADGDDRSRPVVRQQAGHPASTTSGCHFPARGWATATRRPSQSSATGPASGCTASIGCPRASRSTAEGSTFAAARCCRASAGADNTARP